MGHDEWFQGTSLPAIHDLAKIFDIHHHCSRPFAQKLESL
jgi:hypothetical protein